MLAIDFGTSNTVVARWQNQNRITLSLPGLSIEAPGQPPLIPSQIYVTNAATGDVLVGQEVPAEAALRNDPRFFRFFKRGIGVAVPGFVPQLDGLAVTPEQAGTWFVTAVVQAVLRQWPEAATEPWVFTVPVDSFEAYRQWLSQLSQPLGLERIQLLDEPTAAALHYDLVDVSNLLIIDWGGGTLDLALVQPQRRGRGGLGTLLQWGQATFKTKAPKTARVVAKAAQTLGGADLDQWLAAAWGDRHPISLTPQLRQQAEQVKHALSEVESVSTTYDGVTWLTTRAEFNDLLQARGLFERLAATLQQLDLQAQQRGTSLAQVEAVVAVGGTCQIPAIQDWLQQRFPQLQVRTDHPLETVARGALQLAAGMTVRDCLYHSYGLRYWDHQAQAHGWQPLIEAGQPYPLPDPVTIIVGASTPDQAALELVVGELGQPQETTEVYFNQGQLLTRQRGQTQGQPIVQPLNAAPSQRTLATLDPPGQPGGDRLLLSFQVDSQRRLCVTITDLLTSQILLLDQPLIELV